MSTREVDIANLYLQGQLAIDKEGDEREKEKKGTIRIGSSGILDEKTGVSSGNCLRKVHLRYKGLQPAIEISSQLMFDGGLANEDIWDTVLGKTYPHKIKREEELDLAFTLENISGGIDEGSGRPDIVLLDKDDNPEVGIELKSGCSLWTVRDVVFERTPKLPHLIQALNYSMHMDDLPYELWYTSRVNYAISGWASKLFVPHIGSPYLATSVDAKGKTNPKNTTPCNVGYKLKWEKDVAYYKYYDIFTSPQEGEWVRTIITKQGIRAFMKRISQEEIAPRPKNIKATGEKITSWNNCSYCELSDVCDKEENNGYEKWLAAVKQELE